MPNIFKVRRKGYDSSAVTPSSSDDDPPSSGGKAGAVGPDGVLLNVPPSSLTLLLNCLVVSLIASYHGAAISLYDTPVFGKIVYQCLVVPSMYIWGIMFLAKAVYPSHVHSRRDYVTYVTFSVLATTFKALNNFGPTNSQKVFQGLYFIMTDGLWLLAIFSMYGVRPSQPDPNLTYLRFVLLPLFMYSTIYDLTYYTVDVVSNVGVVTSSIWIIASAVVGTFMLLFDVPVDYFRRFVSGHFVQRYHIHLDGNYFAYYAWVIFNLGPGVGILLAKLLKSNGQCTALTSEEENGGDAASDPSPDRFLSSSSFSSSSSSSSPLQLLSCSVPLNDAVILTLALQLFAIVSCHVAEVVCRRAWDGLSFKLLNMQIYFMFNVVQALIFLQVDPWDWRFLKMAAAQQAANLFKNSAVKDLMMWLLGVRSSLPLVDKTNRSLVVKFGSDIGLEFLAILAAYVIFVSENATKDLAVPFNVTHHYNVEPTSGDDAAAATADTDAVVTMPGTMCAATCMGWRSDYGVPSSSYEHTSANRINAGSAAAVLASSFALRYVCIKIEARFVKKVYGKFHALAKSVTENARLKAAKKVGEKVEITRKWKDLTQEDISGWLMNNLAAMFYKEVEDGKFESKETLAKLTVADLETAALFSDAPKYRSRLLTYIKDGVEYGVEVETVVETESTSNEKFEKDMDAPVDLKGVFIAPKWFLAVSFWFAIHFATWAANSANLRMLEKGYHDSRGVW